MNIAVIGLGLIGGSMCKAIKEYTDNVCYGYDINSDTVKKAISSDAIDMELEIDDLMNMDITIVALHPTLSVEFMLENKENFKFGSIVTDVCGVKGAIVSAVSEPLKMSGVTFIGGHPMAGSEFSGFDHSRHNLFENASLILTPESWVDKDKIDIIMRMAKKIKFAKVVLSTPENHDRIIAFTSQLAHVVSNAYIKSPSAEKERGFSAGSYQDLTRVALLNEEMWTDLFVLNSDALVYEIDTIIGHLVEYRDAIKNSDSASLKNLLKEGRILKEKDNLKTIKKA